MRVPPQNSVNVTHFLHDYAEGRMSHAEWLQWWVSHADAVSEQLGRFAFLRIKKRGHGGAVSVLEALGFAVKPVKGFCPSCGEPMFRATPGLTTSEQIRAFAASSKIRSREEILRSGWIHPGDYCANGCTFVLHSFRRT